jgi:hypothetical protein
MSRRVLAALAAISLTACAKIPPAQPPGPAPTREALTVNASFGRTWDAVIDYFARNNIPIRTIERASGIIAADAASVDAASAVEWADCGQAARLTKVRNGQVWRLAPVAAERATYNFLVRGDSTRSTILATVGWDVPERVMYDATQKPYTRPSARCVTRGVWETNAEQAVRARAEAGSP